MHKWILRCGAVLLLGLALYPSKTCKAYEDSVAGIGTVIESCSEKDLVVAYHETMFDFSEKELKILYRIVEAEMTGESIECKMNVTSVVLNRIISDDFPDNLHDVVFQKHQFTPIDDGRYYDATVTQETIDAVQQVLSEGVTTTALYFQVPHNGEIKWGDKTILFKDVSGTYYYN